MLDSAEDLVGFHAGSTLFGRSETPQSRLAENLGVSAAQIQAVAEQIFAKNNLYYALVGELKSAQETAVHKLLRNFGG